MLTTNRKDAVAEITVALEAVKPGIGVDRPLAAELDAFALSCPDTERCYYLGIRGGRGAIAGVLTPGEHEEQPA
jgi:hypothetical protein